MSREAARAAERLLAEQGITARVEGSGPDGSVARIAASPAAWPKLLGDGGGRLAERIRALGFRYVALDLEATHGEDLDDET